MQFRVQVIVDRIRPIGEIMQLIDAGVDCLHIRIFDESTRRLVEFSMEVVNACRGQNAIVLVNGRADVAMAAGADGVQLSREGLLPTSVRTLPGDFLIGASVHSIEEAIQMDRDDVNWMVFGHIFRSTSHLEQAPRGLEQLRCVASATTKPKVAIGGVNPANVDEVRRAGADAVAVIGAVWNAPERDRSAIVQALRKGMDR